MRCGAAAHNALAHSLDERISRNRIESNRMESSRVRTRHRVNASLSARAVARRYSPQSPKPNVTALYTVYCCEAARCSLCANRCSFRSGSGPRAAQWAGQPRVRVAVCARGSCAPPAARLVSCGPSGAHPGPLLSRPLRRIESSPDTYTSTSLTIATHRSQIVLRRNVL